MPNVRRKVSVPATDNVDVNLSPFNRFAGRGGQVSVAATALSGEQDSATFTLLIGSDMVTDGYAIGAEAVAGQGPVKETTRVTGIGAPADPVTLNLQNSSGAAIVIDVDVDIVNA